MKIPLFDIDWTLLKGGNKVHSDAFAYAFKKLYHVDASDNEIVHDGMIDNQIIVEILKLHNISEETAKANIQGATRVMTEYFLQHTPVTQQSIPLPGSKELLIELRQKHIPIGVLTGNVEQIGWKKLENAGLKEYIDFGAFGNMAYYRPDLIPIARRRCNETFKSNYNLGNFVIIGDSPRDVACAKAGGIQIITVASGNYSREELTKVETDLVIGSLEEKEKIFEFLGI